MADCSQEQRDTVRRCYDAASALAGPDVSPRYAAEMLAGKPLTDQQWDQVRGMWEDNWPTAHKAAGGRKQNTLTYFPITDFDLAAITNEVNEWKAAGRFADYDLQNRQQGLIEIRLENLVRNDGSIAVFEIHKVGKRKLLRTKKSWIVQLYSSSSPEGERIKHGCVSAKTLVKALFEAHFDLKHGFMSICDLELVASAV